MYAKFLKFFFLWEFDGNERYLTTCECAPFVTCGCRSFKVSLGILPKIRDRWKMLHYDFYFFGLWFSYVRRSFLREDKPPMVRFSYGFARKVAT